MKEFISGYVNVYTGECSGKMSHEEFQAIQVNQMQKETNKKPDDWEWMKYLWLLWTC